MLTAEKGFLAKSSVHDVTLTFKKKLRIAHLCVILPYDSNASISHAKKKSKGY